MFSSNNIPSFSYCCEGFAISCGNQQEKIFTRDACLGIHIRFKPNTYELFFSTGYESFTRFNNLQPGLDIFFTRNYLKKPALVFPLLAYLLENKEADTSCNFIEQTYLCDPDIALEITKIITCRLAQPAARLFFEAKVLELLTLTFERLTLKASGLVPDLPASDIEMLVAARNLLVADFENIPTIRQLARKVGTNEYKLKQGFKQLFGVSIFAYVQNERLTKAGKLLLETDRSLTDIAFLTGYDYVNNFTVAFKKKFGCTAAWVRKWKSKNR